MTQKEWLLELLDKLSEMEKKSPDEETTWLVAKIAETITDNITITNAESGEEIKVEE